MIRGIIAGVALLGLTGCSTLEWPTDRDEDDQMTARELGERDCRLARASDPAGRGEWVCENPRTGEVERQDRNPVYDNDNR
jgi:hypothetical protein